MKRPSLKRILRSSRFAGVIAILAFAVLRMWDPVPVEIARNFVFDLLQKTRPRSIGDLPLLIADVDEESLRALGQWPWPRATLAQLVEKLRDSGAAVIGFDMVFPESDRLSPRNLAELLAPGDEELKRKLAALPDNDALFAGAIKSARTVLGRTTLSAAQPAPGSKLAPKVSIVTIGGDPSASLLRYPAALKNLPALEAAASGIGMLTVKPERDGLIRRAPLLLFAGGALAPSMAVELIRVAAGASSIIVKRDEAGVRSIAFAGAEIPADADGQLWVAFSHHDARRYVSASAILAGKVPRERIEGKIVLVGTSASGLFDLRSTPLDRVIPGVEIHAQIVESILGGTTLNRPNFALGMEIAIATVLGLILVVTAPLAGALVNLSIGAFIAALIAAVAWYLFAAHRLLIDLSYPLASSFAVFLLLTFMNYLREEKRRTQVRAAFRQYLSPDLVEQLIREPGRLRLGGETREMTILFSDVRGFTSIAETFKSNPEGLTALMNRMLTSLSHPIIRRKGTIDKYIGDAIMAFWNAPLDDTDHALHACESALELMERLEALNRERQREAEEQGTTAADMQIGIGISSGLSVVGNMGSDIRFDYSVLGDTVNLASRLEGLTASYGLRILISAETARRCGEKLALIEVDRVLVKGKREAETVYTVLGGVQKAQEAGFMAFKAAFGGMLGAYRAQDWKEAQKHLERCRANNTGTALAKLLDVYALRLSDFEKAPPPLDWDGVFRAWSPAG